MRQSGYYKFNPRENLNSLPRWHDVRKDLLLNPEDLEMDEHTQRKRTERTHGVNV